MAGYLGHKSWSYWNVSLWLNNDEALYNVMRNFRRAYSSKRAAAKAMLDDLHSVDVYETPDGAKYSVGAIAAAME